MGFDNALWHFDEGVTGFFGQWNTYSTVLVTLLLGIVSYYLFTRVEPDVHPLLLVRQAQGSPVRNEGESPVYRSRAAPHSMPLHSGLDVRDPGMNKWAKGRNGDLRDIYRRVVAGAEDTKAVGKIIQAYGTENVDETSLPALTRQINLIGQHLLDQGGNRVAIYLPNSVEFLASLFACSFYNMTAVLLPFEQTGAAIEDDSAVVAMLRRSAADTVITAPGCFPFDAVVKTYPALRNLVWVVDEGSRHLDWNEVPEGVGGSVNVATWQDIVADAPATAGTELPPLEGQSAARDVTVFWEKSISPEAAEEAAIESIPPAATPGTPAAPSPSPSPSSAAASPEMVRFTSANLVAAVASQLFALPANQRLGPSDLFLPADSLTHTYTLILTLAALYSNASVAFNSAAPGAYDLSAATRGVAPTVVVATPAALLQTHDEISKSVGSGLGGLLLKWQKRTLADGAFPAAASLVSKFLDGSTRSAIGTPPGKLRLLYTAERAGAGTPALSSAVLSDLRAVTGARVIYALAAAKVAGAAAQSAYYDYRVTPGTYAPFGPPLTCTEYLVRDKGTYTVTDDNLQGEIIVRGPSVANNEAALGTIGVIRDDNTLSYA